MHEQQLGQSEGLRIWQRRVQDILDEMRKRSFCDYRASGTWLPTINIYSSDAAYFICVELAGVDRESVVVDCPDPHHVRIGGTRARPRSSGIEDSCSIELLEIDEGPFCRQIDFSENIEVAAIEVAYERGFLWITLRKTGTR